MPSRSGWVHATRCGSKPGLPLYGHELDRNSSPLEAGLSTFVKLGRDFVGSAALTTQRDMGLKKKLIGLQTDDGRMVARQGYRVFRDGDEAGVVTSGTFAPSIQRPIAMAYLNVAGEKSASRRRVARS